jgi:hypothetical protein
MKTFYYVHTGHRIGLDRFRRAVAILDTLDTEITLLSSDYRIAHIARDFGIKTSVGVDVVRNIPYIAENGDRLLFDSDEANPLMLEDMKQYFSTFLHIPNNTIVVEEKFFQAKEEEKSIPLSYFFGDDDYEKDLQKHSDFILDLQPYLQLGFYYFLDYEDMLKQQFTHYFEFEEYDTMIMKSEVIITASPQAVLDALAAGSKPIYLLREDYIHDLLEEFTILNVPIVRNYDKNHLLEILKTINNRKYGTIEQNCNNFKSFIKDNLIL